MYLPCCTEDHLPHVFQTYFCSIIWSGPFTDRLANVSGSWNIFLNIKEIVDLRDYNQLLAFQNVIDKELLNVSLAHCYKNID